MARVFPDIEVIVRVLLPEGARVTDESVFEGTNDGPLPDPDASQTLATRRRVSESFSGIHAVRNGGSSARTSTSTRLRCSPSSV